MKYTRTARRSRVSRRSAPQYQNLWFYVQVTIAPGITTLTYDQLFTSTSSSLFLERAHRFKKVVVTGCALEDPTVMSVSNIQPTADNDYSMSRSMLISSGTNATMALTAPGGQDFGAVTNLTDPVLRVTTTGRLTCLFKIHAQFKMDNSPVVI